MAEKSKKKRRVVKQAKPETVREKAQKSTQPKPKKRRLKSTAKKASTPLKAVGRFALKILRPFRFLLAPFKTRPMRAVGRAINKVLLVDYFKASWKELKYVTWPDRRQTIRLTTAVFLFAIGLTTLVASADWVLNNLFKELILP